MAGEPTMRERMTRVETRLDGMAQDIEVLKVDVSVLKADVSVLKTDVKELKLDMIGVKQELRAIHHRIDVVVEHVDHGFRRQAEFLHAMDEKHERRAAEYEARHYREMDLLRAVLSNHGGRIQRLEDAAGASS
jgi:predicted  nucleic acid-binding Zn-ribbon protein